MTQIQPPDQFHAAWQRRLYQIIFEADTRAGKLFDIVLLFLILASVLAICLETVFLQGEEENRYSRFFYNVEWVVTILFTLEYFARIISVRRPSRYIFSFFGIIDLLAILPTYVAAVSGGGSSLVVLRAIRLLRVFRVLKLVWLLSEANELSGAIWKARGKIVVFLTVVLIAVTIAGAVMYELEGPGRKIETFQSIPQAMYWAIVTMTTVGYGDLVPQTPLGQAFSALLILLGYSLIIVPTGFVSAEFIRSRAKKEVTTRVCDFCMTEGHDADAHYCKYCSQELVK